MEIKNILIIRPRFLGDVILASGLAETLKAACPWARVSFLTEASYTEALRHHPAWDEVLSFDASRRNSLPYLLRFYRELRSKRFDTILDLFGNPRTALISFLSGARVRVGFRLRGRSWASTILAPPSSPENPSGRRPVIEAYLDQVRALGVPVVKPYRTALYVTEAEKEGARAYLKRQGWDKEMVAAIAPGASWPAKRWPAERFMEVGEGLQKKGIRPLFLFGPSEGGVKDVFRTRWMKGWMKADNAPLRELFALVAVSSVLLSNDAGPMHVGPAVGTPTLGLFGPGEPEVWFPYEGSHEVLYQELSCSHCGLDECARMECMNDIPVEAVLAKILTMAVR